ncbi:MAG TPA: helix-turn-helix domain-containing protein [Puia sp.]|jgi:AraC-like DNA-binding protein|nr:helix-turn-helix domain-containing protein [Puia sp.]
MKLQDPVLQKTHPALHWHSVQLPIGLKVATVKESTAALELELPHAGEKGLTLTFIHYKGELAVHPVNRPDQEGQPASPGMGLMSVAARPLLFRSVGSIQFSALSIFLPEPWLQLFLGDNAQFRNIEELLRTEENVITSRLGRRQMSLFSSALSNSVLPGNRAELRDELRAELLRMQNDSLGLFEYFLCNRHRSLLGMSPVSDIENEDDLSLIREVESYISEFYCSDTFTVDSILKKTYTSYHRLNFLFKTIHGMTISEYIRNKRIEKSKEMIADNAKSISQIAYEIGYSSISNYILAFKKVYQITPGKYKKQMGA